MSALTLLGTGASTGIPIIGCGCEVCRSLDPNNRRLRQSALVEIGGKRLLIDASPDLRQQALKYNIEHIDGVLITHAHFDHTGGIDDLRAFYFRTKQPIPCLASPETMVDLRRRYDYLFRPPQKGRSLPAQLDFREVENDRGDIEFEGVQLHYTTYEHGGMRVLGFRFGPIAYISDIRDYPDTIFDDLKGVKILIISALRQEPSPLHLSLDEAVEFSGRIGSEQTWLTHVATSLTTTLPTTIFPNGLEWRMMDLKIDF